MMILNDGRARRYEVNVGGKPKERFLTCFLVCVQRLCRQGIHTTVTDYSISYCSKFFQNENNH